MLVSYSFPREGRLGWGLNTLLFLRFGYLLLKSFINILQAYYTYDWLSFWRIVWRFARKKSIKQIFHFSLVQNFSIRNCRSTCHPRCDFLSGTDCRLCLGVFIVLQ